MRLALAVCLLSVALPARPAERILGFNFPVWSRDGYASPAVAQGLAEAAGMGAGWVALTPTLYVRDRKDSTVAATADTPSDDSLRAAIRAARAAGLKVALKPHVDMLGGGARAWISPDDPGRWFATYRVHVLRYARLAQEEGCSLFVVGTELTLLSAPNHWRDWRALIREVRGVYSGPLTYAANWHSEFAVGFWRDLDFVGVDAYYPNPGGKNKTLLRAGWIPVEAELRAAAVTSGRPVLITEFGIASQKGANLRPWEWKEFGDADPGQQAVYMESFLETFAGKPYIAGFLHWAWDLDTSRAGLQDKSMSIRGKPAAQVLERLFRTGTPTPPPPVPDHAPAAARALAVPDGVRL